MRNDAVSRHLFSGGYFHPQKKQNNNNNNKINSFLKEYGINVHYFVSGGAPTLFSSSVSFQSSLAMRGMAFRITAVAFAAFVLNVFLTFATFTCQRVIIFLNVKLRLAHKTECVQWWIQDF
jgi:hypothetical protein